MKITRRSGLVVLTTLWLGACDGALNQDVKTTPNDAPDQGHTATPRDLGSSPDLSDGPSDMGKDNAQDMGAPPAPAPLSGNKLSSRQDELFMCAPGSISSSPARMRLIGRDEWVRAVGSAYGSAASKNPFDPLPTHRYSTYTDGETLNSGVLDIYMGMMSEAAGDWQGPGRWDSPTRYNPTAVRNIGAITCIADATKHPVPTQECVQSFVTVLLEQGVLYRPATPEEIAPLTSFAMASLELERNEGRSRKSSIRKIVSAAWLMGDALFRREGLTSQDVDEHGRVRLTDWELAQAIAYALDGRPPGAMAAYESGDPMGHLKQVAQAAKDGVIADPIILSGLIHELVAGVDPDRADLKANDDSNARTRSAYWSGNGVRDFFREWLGYMHYLSDFKDSPESTTIYDYNWPTPVSGWDSERAGKRGALRSAYGNGVSGFYGYEPRLYEQLDDMIARILAEDTQVFEQLLTSRNFYVASDSSQYGNNMWWLYNMADPPPATQEGRWVTLPTQERAGVLTHPAFLASHSLNFENDPNPVHRGKWVRENLLCGEVPDVPINVEAALDPTTRDLSTRARVKAKTEQAGCAGCHALMNPLGYPFEIYNHAGILRVEDHGGAPDGSSELIGMPDPALNGPVRDAVEMSEKFSRSQYVKRCFIRQSFRYFMGREETMQDACALNAMEQAYDSSQGSFKAMLSALMTHDTFTYRRADAQDASGR